MQLLASKQRKKLYAFCVLQREALWRSDPAMGHQAGRTRRALYMDAPCRLKIRHFDLNLSVCRYRYRYCSGTSAGMVRAHDLVQAVSAEALLLRFRSSFAIV